MEKQKNLNLEINEDRINELPLEVFYYIEDSHRSAIDFVAHFVKAKDGKYLDKDDAIKAVLTGRTIGDIKDIVEELQEAIEKAAVPKE